MSERSRAVTQKATAATVTPVAGAVLQRQCACGNHAMSAECAQCKDKNSPLQRKPAGERSHGEIPPVVHEVLGSAGQPLDATTRALFEPRFGHDFSQVRVHTNAKAAESTRAVDALAYTVGQDVTFGTGQYAPGTARGNKLLAHELTHVVQQARTGSAVSRSAKAISNTSDAAEVEADFVAN